MINGYIVSLMVKKEKKKLFTEVLSYFYLSKCVESAPLLLPEFFFFFNRSIYTFSSAQYVNTSATSVCIVPHTYRGARRPLRFRVLKIDPPSQRGRESVFFFFSCFALRRFPRPPSLKTRPKATRRPSLASSRLRPAST